MFIDINNRMSGNAGATTDGRQAPTGQQRSIQSRQSLTRMDQTNYQNLLHWTQQTRTAGLADARQETHPVSILSQLQITVDMWFPLITNFPRGPEGCSPGLHNR
jgi:hypothetical protein